MAEKISFSKPSLSPQQQVALLESRGVQVNVREEAEHFLRYHNYNQISGYVFYFEVKGPARTHQLAQPISFSDLISLTLTELRNTCAHHMRLWNKVFVNHPKIRKADETFPIAPDQLTSISAFSTLNKTRRYGPLQMAFKEERL